MSGETVDRLIYRSDVRAIIRCSGEGCRRPYTLGFITECEVFAHEGRQYEERYVMIDERRSFYRDRWDLARIAVAGFECATCGGSFATFVVIKGSFSESVKCGARCRCAVGSSCDCSCGGENHAIGHTQL